MLASGHKALLTGPDGAPSRLLVAFSLLTMSLQRNAMNNTPESMRPNCKETVDPDSWVCGQAPGPVADGRRREALISRGEH